MFQWLYASDQSINHNQTPSKEVEPSMRWRISDRKYFMQPNAKTRCVAYHDASKLLVAGFSNGIFGLYEMPGFQMLYSLRSADCLVLFCHVTDIF